VWLRDGEDGEAEWVVSGKEDFFRGHFKHDPIVPGVLLSEAAAQLSGLVAFSGNGEFGDSASVPSNSFATARLARMDMKFIATVRPPATIRLRAKMIRRLGELMLFDILVQCEGQPVSTGEITLVRATESKGPLT